MTFPNLFLVASCVFFLSSSFLLSRSLHLFCLFLHFHQFYKQKKEPRRGKKGCLVLITLIRDGKAQDGSGPGGHVKDGWGVLDGVVCTLSYRLLEGGLSGEVWEQGRIVLEI